jgi:copper chaperone CopZ
MVSMFFQKVEMKKILTILIFCLPIFSFGQDKVKFLAAGVTCSLCSNAIHKNLTQDKKIEKLDVNLQTQEWNLTYEKGKFNLDSLKQRVENAGFSLAKVWINDQVIFDKTKKRKNGN